MKIKEKSRKTSSNCPHCGVYIKAPRSNIDRYIRKSCPDAPGLDEMEQNRRRRRFDKTVNENQRRDSAVHNEDENDDSGSLLRLRGGARQIRQLPANQRNPDPDILHPHLIQQIVPAIQSINQRLTNRQNRWISSVGPPRLPHNHNNQFWHRVAK